MDKKQDHQLRMRKRDEVLKAFIEKRLCIIALGEGETELTYRYPTNSPLRQVTYLSRGFSDRENNLGTFCRIYFHWKKVRSPNSFSFL